MHWTWEGIGKGFAAVEAIKLLKGIGIKAALVDMGRDNPVSDAPPIIRVLDFRI